MPFRIRPVILWCLRIIVMLQTAFAVPALPEISCPVHLLNGILFPTLLCGAFAAGMSLKWNRDRYYFPDLLIPACAVFLFPGREFVMFFCAGSLFRMDLADDADFPITFSGFVKAAGWGISLFVLSDLLPDCNGIVFLVPLILLSVSIFCNHYAGIRESRFAAAIPFLFLIAAVFFNYPQIIADPQEQRGLFAESPAMAEDPVNSGDPEMLPLLALQVFSGGKIYICADGEGFSADFFRHVSDTDLCVPGRITKNTAGQYGLYYYELPEPRNAEEEFYFSRAFYQRILKNARREDALLAVRVPVPRTDPREIQTAARLVSELPGEVIQLHGPFYRYLVVMKNGAAPDLSGERFADLLKSSDMEKMINFDLTASYIALQAVNQTTLPSSVDGAGNPAAETEISPCGDDGDFLKHCMLWGLSIAAVIYLLCRYFINWLPVHKPVFHFAEKGLCSGGVAALFFASWWCGSHQEQQLVFSLAGGLLLFSSVFFRNRENIIALLIFSVILIVFESRRDIVLPLLAYLILCGDLMLDHKTLRHRFILKDEQMPLLYCISLYAGAISFAVVSVLLEIFPRGRIFSFAVLIALMICHGIFSFSASHAKREKSS